MNNIKNITIANREVGLGCEPFIIAEMSGNHNQDINRAVALVEAAASAGAHAIKFQTYTPDTMTLNISSGDFYISNPESLWSGRSLYDLYGEAYTPWEWHKELFAIARSRGLIPFSSPFDRTAVDFLEDLDVPCYKVASFESTDLPLIRYIASKGKPIIISTGMANISEIDESVREIRKHGCEDIILLKCTSTYPASPENTNILTIPSMKGAFNCQVGLSDHTMGTAVSVASVALGATVIEKHFTLSRADGGVDSTFSLEPDELKALVNDTKVAWQSLGDVHYGPVGDENKSLAFRRSLYVVKDLLAGEVITEENVRAIRPGFGLAPKYLDIVMGKKLKKDVKQGTALSWDLV